VAEIDGDQSDNRDWGGNTSALGGYGSAGLFSRRRQMERTTGGSYANLSDISSAQAPGGYARMPTTGPSPVIRGVEYAPSRPASGPKAMAQFVAPNFNRAGPQEVRPTGNFEKFLTRLGALAPLRQEEEEAEPEAEPEKTPDMPPERPQLGVGKPGGGLVQRPGVAVTRRPGTDVSPYDDIIDAEIVEEIGTTYPALGQEIIDVESPDFGLKPGSVGAIGPAGNPGASSPRAVGPANTRAIGRGALAIGPAGDPGALASSFENQYLGQFPGRRASRGEKRARKDENQGQIYGFDWGSL
jgi:hypothetical protein